MKSLYAVMLFGGAFVLLGVQPVRTQNGNAAASPSSAPVSLKGTLEPSRSTASRSKET